MGKSVLVFISHASEDKAILIEPLVNDLEQCYINVWIDKRKIVPGDNLRKSIFRDGLDKADIALIFFTENSLKSSWVDREIKHVLREEGKKGNEFDLKKIITIFDTKATYDAISERYPELTDDLMHLMPSTYNKIHIGQLISAIWSKYLSLQGGDVETQRQLLSKDREIFQKEKEILELKSKIETLKSKNSNTGLYEEFERFLSSHKIDRFIANQQHILEEGSIGNKAIPNYSEALAFGLVEQTRSNDSYSVLTEKGKEFFKYLFLREN